MSHLHGHHRCILHDVTDITSRTAFSHISQSIVVFKANDGIQLAHMNLKGTNPCFGIGKADINASLKSSPYRSIQLPRHVSCAYYHNAAAAIAHTVHLDKK